MALYNIPFSLPGRGGGGRGVPFSISEMHHKNQAAQGLKFQGPKHSKHFIWVECSNSFLLVKMTYFTGNVDLLSFFGSNGRFDVTWPQSHCGTILALVVIRGLPTLEVIMVSQN